MTTTDKYDRQLRLWGAAGQRALLHSHILLISADGAGSETLKNLVLPGIGAFTILDDHRVSARDLGSNFFVTEDSIGKNRAEVVSENLCEMNPDVKGYATVGNYRNLLRSEQTFFDPFTLIIASNIPTALLLSLAERCWNRDIPLVLVRSYGLIGTVRIQIKEHFIDDHRKEGALFDLRLSNPFPSLQHASDSLKVEFASLNSSEKKHIPYIFLLIWALEEWRENQRKIEGYFEGSPLNFVPKSFEEKQHFRSFLTELINEKWSLGETTAVETDKTAAGRDSQPENETVDQNETVTDSFTSHAGFNGIEAIREAHRVFSDKTLSPEILDFLSTTLQVDEEKVDFLERYNEEKNRPLKIQFHRRLFRTLLTFLKRSRGKFPLPGAIPDLTSTSSRFLQLQQLYHQESNKDCELFVTLLREREQLEKSEVAVPLDEAVSFCKSVFATSLLSTTQIAEEENGSLYGNIGEHLVHDCIADDENDPLLTPLSWALAIKACDTFFLQQGRFPGDDPTTATTATQGNGEEGWKQDAEKVWFNLKEIAEKCNVTLVDSEDVQSAAEEEVMMDDDEDKQKPPAVISKKTAIEIARYGGAELHTISATIGGVAAQEAVKLITGQYVPLDGLFVYNGIASIGGTYSLKG